MNQYRELVEDILENGQWRKPARENIPRTKAIQGGLMRFDLREGFPVLTTKRVAKNVAFTEILWMLRGDTNLEFPWANNCHVWDKDFARFNECEIKDLTEGSDGGLMYGYNWRSWKGFNYKVDQIVECVEKMVKTPETRKNIVTAWNPEAASESLWALDACHNMFQVDVNDELGVTVQVNIRSSDVALGLPFNIIQYALLTHILCDMADALTGAGLNGKPHYQPKQLVVTLGNVHIYENHIELLKEQIQNPVLKSPRLETGEEYSKLLTMLYDKTWDGFEDYNQGLSPKMFKFSNYNHAGDYKYELFTGLKEKKEDEDENTCSI